MNTNINDKLRFEGIMSDGFGMAPRIVMRDTRLSVEAKGIYAYFQSFAGSSDHAFPSRNTILKELGMSKSRYYKYLNELIDCNYIRIERETNDKGWKERNIYVIVSNPKSDVIEPLNTKNQENKEVDKVSESIIVPVKKKCNLPVHKKAEQRKSENHELYERFKIDKMISKFPKEKSQIKSVYNVLKDMVSEKEIKVGEIVYNSEEILQELSWKNIIDVIISTTEYDKKIKNKKAWYITCLINSRYLTEEELDKKIRKLERKYMQRDYDPGSNPCEVEVLEKPDVPVHIKKLKFKLNKLYSERAKGIINKALNLDEINKEIEIIEGDIEKYEIKNNTIIAS